VIGLLLLLAMVSISFAAGYLTREAISRRRRAQYLKFKPYLRPPTRPPQPPAFLIHPANNSSSRPRRRSNSPQP
jgi:hypothetical protein